MTNQQTIRMLNNSRFLTQAFNWLVINEFSLPSKVTIVNYVNMSWSFSSNLNTQNIIHVKAETIGNNQMSISFTEVDMIENKQLEFNSYIINLKDFGRSYAVDSYEW